MNSSLRSVGVGWGVQCRHVEKKKKEAIRALCEGILAHGKWSRVGGDEWEKEEF